jgi:hypothetical protein
MLNKNLLLLTTTVALLIACMDTQKPTEPISTTECAATDFKYLIGKGQSTLNNLTIQDPHRIILPNSAVTMDYNEMRINFLIGETGLIESIKCF